MGWWTPQLQAYAVNYLIVNGGLTLYGAAGLVSRWVNVEAPNGPASRGGYLNRAWGIGQWLGARLPAIDGNPDFDDQLAYVVQELNGGDRTSAELATPLLRSATDAYTAARGATAYERAGGWNASARTDSFTARTAAGIPAVIANYQANSGQVPVTITQPDPVPNPGGMIITTDPIVVTIPDDQTPASVMSEGVSSTKLATIAIGVLVGASILKRMLNGE